MDPQDCKKPPTQAVPSPEHEQHHLADTKQSTMTARESPATTTCCSINTTTTTDLWAMLGEDDGDTQFEMLGNFTSEELLMAYDKDENDEDMEEEPGDESSLALLQAPDEGEGMDNPQAPCDDAATVSTLSRFASLSSSQERDHGTGATTGTTTLAAASLTTTSCASSTPMKLQDKKQLSPTTKKIINTPKRPLSAYNLFFKAFRAKLSQDNNHSLNFAQLGKEVARQWKCLPASKRVKYEVVARKDSLRYRAEMQAYKAQSLMMDHTRTKHNNNCGPTWLHQLPSLSFPPPSAPAGGNDTKRTGSQQVSNEGAISSSNHNSNNTMVVTATTTNATTSTTSRPSSSSGSSSRSVNYTTNGSSAFLQQQYWHDNRGRSATNYQDRVLYTITGEQHYPSQDSTGPPPPPYPQSSDQHPHENHRHHQDSITHPYNLPRPIILRDPSRGPSPQELSVPPGTIVTLPDPHGRTHRFIVSYQMQPMPYTQAVAYVDAWSRSILSSTSSPPTTHTMAPWISVGVPNTGHGPPYSRYAPTTMPPPPPPPPPEHSIETRPSTQPPPHPQSLPPPHPWW